MRSSDVYTVNTYILTNESKPIFLCLPRLSTPPENALVGSLRVLPRGGTWYRHSRFPSPRQPHWALVERRPFLPTKIGQGSSETPPWLPPAPCTEQQVTPEDSPWHPDILTSWQDGQLSSHNGWAFIILVSGLNYFLANEKVTVAYILSLLIIVSSFFCLLGHRYQLCPPFPLHLWHKAFFGAGAAVPKLALCFRVCSSLVVTHISHPCTWPCIILQCALVYTATESVQRKYLTHLCLSDSALPKTWKNVGVPRCSQELDFAGLIFQITGFFWVSISVCGTS